MLMRISLALDRRLSQPTCANRRIMRTYERHTVHPEGSPKGACVHTEDSLHHTEYFPLLTQSKAGASRPNFILPWTATDQGRTQACAPSPVMEYILHALCALPETYGSFSRGVSTTQRNRTSHGLPFSTSSGTSRTTGSEATRRPLSDSTCLRAKRVNTLCARFVHRAELLCRVRPRSAKLLCHKRVVELHAETALKAHSNGEGEWPCGERDDDGRHSTHILEKKRKRDEKEAEESGNEDMLDGGAVCYLLW
eukprot:6214617-Pleurochrysis_carterae.AAC.2